MYLRSRCVAVLLSTHPQYTLWEKAQTSQNHLMRQFQIPNTHLVNHRYIAVQCASCFHYTCQMNTCDIYQHILLTLALLTYNTAFNRSPACASGILICRRFVPHPSTVYTMGKGTNMIKSSNATIPDPQHTSRGLSIYRGSVCLMSPTYMPISI